MVRPEGTRFYFRTGTFVLFGVVSVKWTIGRQSFLVKKLFGLPLSEAAVEINPTDGKPYLTQHFERARFEYHPENAGTPYDILLGLLSREQTNSATALPSFAAEVIELVNKERAASPFRVMRKT